MSRPKPRPAIQCKKTTCKRYESYKKWSCADRQLKFCINCKWAHVSQYEAKGGE